MRLQCPVCHSFVFERFRTIEALLVIAAIGIMAYAITKMALPLYVIPVFLVGLIAFEYSMRLVYIWIHNLRNENIY